MADVRRLSDLGSVGPATLADFEVLGIRSMEQLARCEAHELYQRLCAVTGEAPRPLL
jgi:nucleotidyltransferase/DNA polymerase involved in DNA repair